MGEEDNVEHEGGKESEIIASHRAQNTWTIPRKTSLLAEVRTVYIGFLFLLCLRQGDPSSSQQLVPQHQIRLFLNRGQRVLFPL